MTKEPPQSTRKRYPLESFDPRYKDLLLRAAKESFTIHFETWGEARAFQTRCWTYRNRAKEANLPDWRILYRCKVSASATERGGPTTLTFSPLDSAFEHAFAQAQLPTVEDPEFENLNRLLEDPVEAPDDPTSSASVAASFLPTKT